MAVVETPHALIGYLAKVDVCFHSYPRPIGATGNYGFCWSGARLTMKEISGLTATPFPRSRKGFTT